MLFHLRKNVRSLGLEGFPKVLHASQNFCVGHILVWCLFGRLNLELLKLNQKNCKKKTASSKKAEHRATAENNSWYESESYSSSKTPCNEIRYRDPEDWWPSWWIAWRARRWDRIWPWPAVKTLKTPGRLLEVGRWVVFLKQNLLAGSYFSGVSS